MSGLLRDAREIQPDDPRRNAASIAMFDQVAKHWALRSGERETLLGGVSKSTWSEWKQRPLSSRVKLDTRERIANLFTIDLNLHSLFAPEFADRWLRQPNAAFDGNSAAEVMLRGKVEDIVTVRRYLERTRASSSTRDDGADTAEQSSSETLPVLLLAVSSCRRLASEQPGRFESTLGAALENLATYLIELGDIEEAFRVIDRMIELRPTMRAENLHRAMSRFFELSRTQDSVTSAVSAIKAKHPHTAAEFADACHDVFAMLDAPGTASRASGRPQRQ